MKEDEAFIEDEQTKGTELNYKKALLLLIDRIGRIPMASLKIFETNLDKNFNMNELIKLQERWKTKNLCLLVKQLEKTLSPYFDKTYLEERKKLKDHKMTLLEGENFAFKIYELLMNLMKRMHILLTREVGSHF